MDFRQNTNSHNDLYSFYKSIQNMIDESIRNAPFDKTKSGLILESIGNGLYIVEIDKQKYTMRSAIQDSLSKNNIVKVVVPENQMSLAYIRDILV